MDTGKGERRRGGVKRKVKKRHILQQNYTQGERGKKSDLLPDVHGVCEFNTECDNINIYVYTERPVCYK